MPIAHRPPHAALLAGLAALVGGWVLVFRLATVAVTLDVDGAQTTLQTHCATVADLLLEAGVPLSPGDLVQPPPVERLTQGARVMVHHVREVAIVADGSTQVIRSLGQTPLAVLRDAGLSLAHNDRLIVAGQAWSPDALLPAPKPPRFAGSDGDPAGFGWPPLAGVARAQELGEDPSTLGADADDQAPDPALGQSGRPLTSTLVIDVLRAVPITVVDGGVPLRLSVAGASVGEALQSAGLGLDEGDDASPPAAAPLVEGMTVAVNRAVSFALTDGESEAPKTVRARADTVGQALVRLGLGLEGRDFVVPAADTPLTPGLHVEVVRVREDVLVEEVAMAFGRDEIPDPEMDLDTTRVVKPGEDGLKRQKVRITYANGREKKRDVIESEVLREPVKEQVAYGTRIVWRTVDTPEGPIRYWRKLRMYATSYSASRAGTSPDKPWYGHTRIGLPMQRGIVAVNEKVIYLGTHLYVPGYGRGLAGDTGRLGVFHVDLGFDDDNYESYHWSVDVYCIEPLPPEIHIRYILPEGPVSPFFYGR